MIEEHDRVILTQALPKDRLQPGDVGTVVHVYEEGAAYELEFVARHGHTAAVVTVPASGVRAATRTDIPHARSIEA